LALIYLLRVVIVVAITMTAAVVIVILVAMGLLIAAMLYIGIMRVTVVKAGVLGIGLSGVMASAAGEGNACGDDKAKLKSRGRHWLILDSFTAVNH
jgi:hypothetical protein